MQTPEATRRLCDALYQAMAELDAFEDRSRSPSPTTKGNFNECYEMFLEIAQAKGFVTHTPVARQHDASQSPRQEDEELPEQEEVQFHVHS
jgi:hypothetical protein